MELPKTWVGFFWLCRVPQPSLSCEECRVPHPLRLKRARMRELVVRRKGWEIITCRPSPALLRRTCDGARNKIRGNRKCNVSACRHRLVLYPTLWALTNLAQHRCEIQSQRIDGIRAKGVRYGKGGKRPSSSPRKSLASRFPLSHSGGCYGCWQEGSLSTVFFV